MKAEAIIKRLAAAKMPATAMVKEAGLWEPYLVAVRMDGTLCPRVGELTPAHVIGISVDGTPAQWGTLFTLPRRAAMALAALEAGCYARKMKSGWIGRTSEGAVPEIFPARIAALAAVAEALGLEPWTGRE